MIKPKYLTKLCKKKKRACRLGMEVWSKLNRRTSGTNFLDGVDIAIVRKTCSQRHLYGKC